MTRQIHKELGYPIETMCHILGLSRSSYYYTTAQTEKDQEIEAAIKDIAQQFPCYGSRRITYQLRREPHQLLVNRKKVQRIMQNEDLLVTVKRKSTNTTNSNHSYPRYPNLVKEIVIDHPDQVWVSDLTYIGLEKGFVYLGIIMDVFTRCIRGWSLSKTIDHYLAKAALQMALEKGKPEIHHSDQGVQYAAHEYVNMLHNENISISMSKAGSPQENGYAERVIRTIKEEEVYLSEYIDFQDANQQIGYFIDRVYQYKRIHSSLGYLTPVEFEQDWWSNHRNNNSPLDINILCPV